MTRASGVVAMLTIFGAVGLHQASSWWERTFATHLFSETSPDGCIRIDTFKPFWILPSIFHRNPDPDPAVRNSLGRVWDSAVFKRAYEVSTGEVLGETVTFGPLGPAYFIDWGDTHKPGRRVIVANQFPLADTNRCSDEATLGRLEAYHERKREASQAEQEKLRKERAADGHMFSRSF